MRLKAFNGHLVHSSNQNAPSERDLIAWLVSWDTSASDVNLPERGSAYLIELL